MSGQIYPEMFWTCGCKKRNYAHHELCCVCGDARPVVAEEKPAPKPMLSDADVAVADITLFLAVFYAPCEGFEPPPVARVRAWLEAKCVGQKDHK